MKLEKVMKSLQVNNLYLYPRIKATIKRSLDNLQNLNIIEYEIEFSQITLKIHKLLMKLLQECLDELKREFKKFPNLDHSSLEEQMLNIENALVGQFFQRLRQFIG